MNKLTEAEREEFQICEAMASVQREYFPELNDRITFTVEAAQCDGIEARATISKDALEIALRYRDTRILDYKYRPFLVPVVAHELAHLISPVDPERVMRQRLPPEVMALWDALLEEGYASCSMKRRS